MKAQRSTVVQDCEIPVYAGRLSLWRELFWPIDWLDLRASSVYRGRDVDRGDGRPIVLVPGFMASDASMFEMHRWLRRLGFDSRMSRIGRNSDCPDVLLEKLEERAEEVYAETGHAVTLIGHSLGGVLARAMAVRRPDLVAQVITLGSPVGTGEVHPLVLSLIKAVSKFTPTPSERPRIHGDHDHCGSCSCSLSASLGEPFPAGVPRASIYSRRDGVVDWRSSIDDAPGLNIPVNCTHLGMTVSREVYEAVASLLAPASAVTYPLAA